MTKLLKTNTATENIELVRACETQEEMTELLNTATVKMLDAMIYEAGFSFLKKIKKAEKIKLMVQNFMAERKLAEKIEVGATYSNPNDCQEEITEIQQVMASLENKTYLQKINFLEKCSEAFLWDMCRAYGVTPNDNKRVMTRRILNCEKTTAEKIQILEQILPDVRIAFNCWTDNGKLSVNEAYKQSLRRLEAWLIFLLRKEKKL